MSALHFHSDNIDFEISDVLADGKVTIEAVVKVDGPDKGKKTFVGDIVNKAVKVAAQDRAAYWSLAKYVPVHIAAGYVALV